MSQKLKNLMKDIRPEDIQLSKKAVQDPQPSLRQMASDGLLKKSH